MGASSVKHVHVLLRSIEELREYEAGLGIPDLDEGQSVLEHVWLSPLGGVLILTHTHTHTCICLRYMYPHYGAAVMCKATGYFQGSYFLSFSQLFHAVPLTSSMQVMKLPSLNCKIRTMCM